MNPASAYTENPSTGGTTAVEEEIRYSFSSTRGSLHSERLQLPASQNNFASLSPTGSATSAGSAPVTVKSRKSGTTVHTKRSGRLVRPERRTLPRSILEDPRKRGQSYSAWDIFAITLTVCVRPWCLVKCCKKTHPDVQHAWREKIALCFICIFMCAILGWLTFGLTTVVCGPQKFAIPRASFYKGASQPHWMSIRGSVYDLTDISSWHNSLQGFKTGLYSSSQLDALQGIDISEYFSKNSTACINVAQKSVSIQCSTPDINIQHCHDYIATIGILSSKYIGPLVFNWQDIQGSSLMVVRGSVLDMSSYLKNRATSKFLGDWVDNMIVDHIGYDATRALTHSNQFSDITQCLIDMYLVGTIEDRSIGCIATDIILYISLIVILTFIAVRFLLAVIFKWCFSLRMNLAYKKRAALQALQQSYSAPSAKGHVGTKNLMPIEQSNSPERANVKPPKIRIQPHSDGQDALSSASTNSTSSVGMKSLRMNWAAHGNLSTPTIQSSADAVIAKASDPENLSRVNGNIDLLHTLILVTCYSEGKDELQKTFDSLAETVYPNTHKTLLIISDGIIKGRGNEKSTPDLILDMIELDEEWRKNALGVSKGGQSLPLTYRSIGSGEKSENRAMVYVGQYTANKPETSDEPSRCSIPTVVVIKCGSEEEAGDPNKKPGNRGKRDSQVVIMGLLERLLSNAPLSALDYELCSALNYVSQSKTHPSKLELLLMVDADTQVERHSLSRMVDAMAADPRIMGLCGETRIANKNESWVSRIQVFEYYLSHHMNKAFESVFGGVTCLPGCFCMYRIKTRRNRLRGSSGTEYDEGKVNLTILAPSASETMDDESFASPDGDMDENGNTNPAEETIEWVPLLANHEIVGTYSEDNVRTLHQKNLLLLGEDRFLTTLMLRQFPRRKLIFVPEAICKTTVPAEFRVLLSQRRRWINSTVHNLLELLLVRELCGVFCFSMQFVILLELIGTITLPAAICFTFLLIIVSIIGPIVPIIPLFLLAAILGLPAVLILLTSRRFSYIYWMFIYLLALPIWNFILPTYAFWHFDDFSWGETRVIEGEKRRGGCKEGDHGSGGVMKVLDTGLVLKSWEEWEAERRMVLESRRRREMARRALLSENVVGK